MHVVNALRQQFQSLNQIHAMLKWRLLVHRLLGKRNCSFSWH